MVVSGHDHGGLPVAQFGDAGQRLRILGQVDQFELQPAGGQRPAELDPLLQAVGKAADGGLADVLDLEEVDDLLDPAAMLDRDFSIRTDC